MRTSWSTRRSWSFRPARRCARPSSTWRRCSSRTSRPSGIPSKYTDEYRDNLMKLIKARIKGEKPKLPSAGAAAGRQGRRPDGAPAPEPRAESETGGRASTQRARPTDDAGRRSRATPRDGDAKTLRRRSLLARAARAAACRETGDVQVTSIKFTRQRTPCRPDELKAVHRHARERIPAVVAQALLRSPGVRSRRPAHRGVLRRSRLSQGQSRRRRRRS